MILYELNTLIAKSKVLTGWAGSNGANHKFNQFTVDEILTDPQLEPDLDFEGNPKLDINGNPIFKITGQGIWSKIQEIYDFNKNFNIYWLDV